uniref:Major facilitator superfamily (MFS) profile domain-containing protein n=1 Tax=Setaria italica TaxID=4555 RepID=K4A218_SETIT
TTRTLLPVFLGTGSVAEAMETMLLSFVGPSVKAECLGSDRYGRRFGVLITALVTSISGFLCAFSPNYPTLLVLRFVVGLGLGASHVLSVWFLEFVPAENRGSWMDGFACFWSIGTILEALLAWAVMPILGWRWLLALTSSPYFVLLIFSCLIPESPRYLCSRGKINEATLRSDNLDASVTTLLLMPEDGLGTDENISSKSHSTNNAFQALWPRDLTVSTLLLWLVKFACFFAYYGIILLTSKVSDGKRICTSVGTHVVQPKDSSLYINVLVTSFAEFPANLLAAPLLDRVGRRMSLGGMILLCCAFLAPLAVQLGEGLAITLLFCARACIEGCFVVLLVYSPEIYPTSCRNTGVGIANCIGQVGSIVAPLVTVTLVENCHQKEAVFVIDLLVFPLETKGLRNP